MRVLLRVALGANWDEAVALQHQFQFRAIGQAALPTIPKTPIFDIEALLGVEAFEAAELALDSEADINPGMKQLQATTRAIARAVKEPATRARVDQVIRSKALAEFKKAMPTLGDGTVRNGWVLSSTIGVYGKNWLLRTLVNDGGIWANTMEEVIYYKAFVDPSGNRLSGDHAYALHFPEGSAAGTVRHVLLVRDCSRCSASPRAPESPEALSPQQGTNPQYGQDGSLTLYFADAKPKEAPDGNWLPTPKGIGYSLTFRFYRPRGAVAQRTYFPPPLTKL
jgi:hypothetical protein